MVITCRRILKHKINVLAQYHLFSRCVEGETWIPSMVIYLHCKGPDAGLGLSPKPLGFLWPPAGLHLGPDSGRHSNTSVALSRCWSSFLARDGLKHMLKMLSWIRTLSLFILRPHFDFDGTCIYLGTLTCGILASKIILFHDQNVILDAIKVEGGSWGVGPGVMYTLPLSTVVYLKKPLILFAFQ